MQDLLGVRGRLSRKISNSPRPARVGRKARRQRLHLPRTAATISVSSSTPFCERTSSTATINAVLVAGDVYAAERQFRHLAGEVFGRRSTRVRCVSVPPETMSSLRDFSVCQPIWRCRGYLPPTPCSGVSPASQNWPAKFKLFAEERFASYFLAQMIAFPNRQKVISL